MTVRILRNFFSVYNFLFSKFLLRKNCKFGQFRICSLAYSRFFTTEKPLCGRGEGVIIPTPQLNGFFSPHSPSMFSRILFVLLMDMVKLDIFECSTKGIFFSSSNFGEKYISICPFGPIYGRGKYTPLGLLPRVTRGSLTNLN